MVASLPIIGGFPADTDRPDIPRGVRRVRGNAAPEKRTRIRSVDGSRSQSLSHSCWTRLVSWEFWLL